MPAAERKRSSIQSRVLSMVATRSCFVPCSAKNTFTSCSNSRTGPSPGVGTHAAIARRPFAVIEYTVRGRLPTFSDVALARPCATSFFGSS